MPASCRDTAAEATRFHFHCSGVREPVARGAGFDDLAGEGEPVNGGGVAEFGSGDRLPEFATRSFVLLLGLSGAVCGRRTANSVGRVDRFRRSPVSGLREGPRGCEPVLA